MYGQLPVAETELSGELRTVVGACTADGGWGRANGRWCAGMRVGQVRIFSAPVTRTTVRPWRTPGENPGVDGTPDPTGPRRTEPPPCPTRTSSPSSGPPAPMSWGRAPGGWTAGWSSPTSSPAGSWRSPVPRPAHRANSSAWTYRWARWRRSRAAPGSGSPLRAPASPSSVRTAPPSGWPARRRTPRSPCG